MSLTVTNEAPPAAIAPPWSVRLLARFAFLAGIARGSAVSRAASVSSSSSPVTGSPAFFCRSYKEAEVRSPCSPSTLSTG